MKFKRNYRREGTMKAGNKEQWWTAEISLIFAHVFSKDGKWYWKVNDRTSLSGWTKKEECFFDAERKVRLLVNKLLKELDER